MRLSELLKRAEVAPDRVAGDALIDRLVMDSRQVTVNALFAAVPSENTDSHLFLEQARTNGASAAITHSQEGFQRSVSLGMATAMFSPRNQSFNEAIWRIAKVAFGNPSASMKVVGITGTNGKTTTAWVMRDMLQASGLAAGYIGTLGFQIPGESRELSNTTPLSIELNTLMAEANERGVEAMAIEVSSHALVERRADGIEFDAAVFTNLTQDHLDFHRSMEAYEAAKLRLFTELPGQSAKRFRAAVNVDDPAGVRLNERLADNSLSFGLRYGQLRALDADVSIDRIELDLALHRRGFHSRGGFVASLGGSYNVENLLAATAGILSLDESLTLDDCRPLWRNLRPVPGRFETVPNDSGISVLVDYAHTPDALEKLLNGVRPLTEGRIITVFGCGGDRDRAKRPLMAKAVSERSDVTVVTSDNPRTEDPQTIVCQIVPGIAPGKEHVAILDREEAVAHAIKIARSGDVVVIAGKGHENYQIIGHTKFPMDDRELARKGLALR